MYLMCISQCFLFLFMTKYTGCCQQWWHHHPIASCTVLSQAVEVVYSMWRCFLMFSSTACHSVERSDRLRQLVPMAMVSFKGCTDF